MRRLQNGAEAPERMSETKSFSGGSFEGPRRRLSFSHLRLIAGHPCWLAATVLVISLTAAAVAAAAEQKNEARETYFLVLAGEPSGQTFGRLRATLSGPEVAAAVSAREAEIKSQQEALVRQLEARGHIVSGRFSHVVNAIRVHVRPGQASELLALPGVVRVEKAVHKQRLLTTSVPFIGGPLAWGMTPTNADGTGVRIGIIDTGIDYTHADFGGPGDPNVYSANDPTVIEPGTFPTAKVVGGTDFVGDSYDASTPGLNIPSPDPDPLDCDGHGTHVAGIAAGLGVTTNGATYLGPYTTTIDYRQFSIGPGVAPKALLYALKIFGCSGSTDADVDAMDWAATAGTGDFNNHLDVVNLSLGSSFGLSGPSLENDAADQLADLGCVVAIAAGNSGNTFYIVSSPGAADKCICVANSTIGSAIQVNSPASIAGGYSAVEGDFTVPLSQSGPIQANLVYASPNDACTTLSNPGQLTGNIALIDRGTCFFVDKVQLAQEAGALGVIMVNNVAGDPIVMGGTPSYTVTIPGVMISQSDGALLKAHLGENPVVRMGTDVIVAHPQLADRIDPSSSRGPAAPINLLKPEIAAPGSGIHSAAVGTGSNGVTLSGTSMATPHVAGAAALLRQLHASWTVEEIKAALMNTARPTRDGAGNSQPESRSGAGRLQINDAARLMVTAKAQNSGGLVTLNFGALELAGPYTQTKNVVLQNHSPAPVTFTVVISNNVTETGLTLAPLSNPVTVPGNGSVLVPLQLTATPNLFNRTSDPTTPSTINGQPAQTLYETSGQVWFLNPALSIHVPYYASVRAASVFEAGLTDLALPTTNTLADVNIGLFGASAHPQPLVSAFQLGAVSPKQNLSDPALTPVDLLAVGAATDAGSQGAFANSTVYFGIAVSSNWTSPQSFITDLRIQIDTNNDGVADLEILNSTAGNASSSGLSSPSSANNVLQSVLAMADDTFLAATGYLDIFGATTRDTAPFNNTVLVLSAPVQSLGLSIGNSQFSYRAVSYAPGSGIVFDQTDWSMFDAAQPVIDSTLQGIGAKPFFADGQSLQLRINKAAAAGNGLSPTGIAGLLLLHHFNTVGQQLEVLNLHLDATDTTVPIKILPPARPGPGGRTIRWTSQPNQLYTVQYSTNLAAGFPFQAASNLSATPPFNAFTDSTPQGNSPIFYRIKQQ